MANLLENTLLIGLGVCTLTREKVREAVNELVQEEGVELEEAQRLADALIARGEREREELRDVIRQEMSRVSPVTPKEFDGLRQEVEQLPDRLDSLANSE